MTFLPSGEHVNMHLDHLLSPKRNKSPYIFNKLFSFLSTKCERHVVKGTAHLITEVVENLRLWMFRGFTRFPVSVGWTQDTALGSKENTVKGSRAFHYSTEKENRRFGLNFEFCNWGDCIVTKFWQECVGWVWWGEVGYL